MAFLKQSFILLLSFGLVFLWEQTSLAAFTMGNEGYLLESTIEENHPPRMEARLDSARQPIVTTPSYAPTNASIPFTLSLSNTVVDYGTLSPTEPVTRTTTLTVSHGAANGYRVLVSEEHELRSEENASIPDASCDNGSCTERIASYWRSILSYGFGYRCDNLFREDCDPGFLQPDFFKQFPNTALSEPPETLMANSTWGRSKKATITFKVNVAKAQAEGSYRNTVTFLTVPNF